MKKFCIFLLALILVSGCIDAKPKLPASFCNGLENEEVRENCLSDTKYLDDDQRVREYYERGDALMTRLVELHTCAEELVSHADAWAVADTASERSTHYQAYSAQAPACIDKTNEVISHIDDIVNFMSVNKEYLSSQGLDIQAEIETLETAKRTLEESFGYIEGTIANMQIIDELE